MLYVLQKAWIGLKKNKTTRKWEWIKRGAGNFKSSVGTEVVNVTFAEGQPDNRDPRKPGEDDRKQDFCGMLVFGADTDDTIDEGVHDYPCDMEVGRAICEMHLAGTVPKKKHI